MCLTLPIDFILPAGSDEKGPRRRKAPPASDPGSTGDTRKETNEVTVETLHCVQTDTSPDALQKAVCFSDDHTLLATGGVDGFLRVWEVPAVLVGGGGGLQLGTESKGC